MLDDKLEVMLTEYKHLREEIKHNFDLQLKLYGFLVSGLGVFYGLIFYAQAHDLILIVPFIFLPLLFRVQHSNYSVQIMGEYLYYSLERKIRTFMGNTNWIGWQNCWTDRTNKNKVGDIYAPVVKYDYWAKSSLFVLLPFGVAIIYSGVVFFNSLMAFIAESFGITLPDILTSNMIECANKINTCLDWRIHLILIIVYFGLIYWGIKKKLKNMKSIDDDKRDQYWKDHKHTDS